MISKLFPAVRIIAVQPPEMPSWSRRRMKVSRPNVAAALYRIGLIDAVQRCPSKVGASCRPVSGAEYLQGD